MFEISKTVVSVIEEDTFRKSGKTFYDISSEHHLLYESHTGARG